MGIRSLTSFLEIDRDFFAARKLRNCRIVIDGNNLRFVVFQQTKSAKNVFGGDYEDYRKCVEGFFRRLEACGIEAVVIMDGAHDQAKMRTSLKRTKDQAKLAVLPQNSLQKSIVLPAFAKEVFTQTLQELENVELIQTNFEADFRLAEKAETEKIPLLSNDSDFFILNNCEFIHLNSLSNCVENDENGNFMNCQEFDRRSFLDHYNIQDPKMLHLMSTLLGNDYVKLDTFERFFHQLSKPKKGKKYSPRHRAIIGLLNWLGRENDWEKAVEKVLTTIPKEERPKLMQKLTVSMKMYNEDQHLDLKMDSSFEDRFARCIYPNHFMDILANHEFIMSSQIEERSEISSHLFSQRILEKTASVILKDTENVDEVTLHCRQGPTIRPFKLKVSRNDEQSVYEILNIDEKLVQLLDEIHEDLKLLLLCINFWTTNMRVHFNYIKVLAFSYFIKSNVLNDLYFKYKKGPAKAKPSSLEFTKKLAYLQSVLYHGSQLCKLTNLDDKLKFDVCKYWHGTFLFGLNEDLEYFGPDRFEHLLKDDSGLLEDYQKVLNLFMKFAQVDISNVKPGKRRNRKKKQQKCADICQQESDEEFSNRFECLNLSE